MPKFNASEELIKSLQQQIKEVEKSMMERDYKSKEAIKQMNSRINSLQEGMEWQTKEIDDCVRLGEFKLQQASLEQVRDRYEEFDKGMDKLKDMLQMIRNN